MKDAFSTRHEIDQQVALQERNVQLAEKTEQLTQVHYKNGAVALKNLINAQRTTREARLSFVQAKQTQYNDYVTLLQALGGSPIQQLP